ncbi:MAG: polysaccharide deacetylase family protein [Halobacteriovoraceae bacterium]|nr:polysaccharide deacetylase family protein [Halobacteriovoraceae bacterium]
MRNSALFSGNERTEMLTSMLNKYHIQAAFFVITSKLSKDNGLQRMNQYNDAGHIIANHTHKHHNFDVTSIKTYIANFNTADNLLKQFSNFKPWFRYPMLRHGNTIKKRDAMREHLSKQGYLNGYVTLDIQDWFMASLVNNHLYSGKTVNKVKLCHAYSEIIWDTIEFYDTKSQEILQRSPKHMLLLHENDLAALCLEKLILKIKNKGWDIISPTEVITDEIYGLQPNTLFNNNGQIAALYFKATGIKLYDPWAFPWNDGELIRNEFKRRGIFEQ